VATVVPRAFGVRGIDGRDPRAANDPASARHIVVHLLPANTALPADTGPYTFHTAIENQRMVGIEVWEQDSALESEDLESNRKVGEAMLRNLPPRLPTHSPVEVTFFMSEMGLLTVQAIEPGSGTDLRFELQIGDLDQPGMDRARQSVAQYQVSG
jgi:molecular chaperone DnaK (HSP70)